MTSSNMRRVQRLEPRALELAEWLNEQRGEQLTQVIRRSLDRTLDEVTALLEADGQSGVAARVRREWPRWVARIVPEEIAAVTGATVADDRPGNTSLRAQRARSAR